MRGADRAREAAMRANQGSSTEGSDSSPEEEPDEEAGHASLSESSRPKRASRSEQSWAEDFGPEMAQRMSQRLQELQAAGLQPAESDGEGEDDGPPEAGAEAAVMPTSQRTSLCGSGTGGRHPRMPRSDDLQHSIRARPARRRRPRGRLLATVCCCLAAAGVLYFVAVQSGWLVKSDSLHGGL